MRDDLLEVLELYPEFAESFSANLEVTFNLRDEDVFGVDPSVFRRFTRELEHEEVEEENTEHYHDKRSQVKDFKMPRRKTTRRKKGHKVADPHYYSEEQESDEILIDAPGFEYQRHTKKQSDSSNDTPHSDSKVGQSLEMVQRWALLKIETKTEQKLLKLFKRCFFD